MKKNTNYENTILNFDNKNEISRLNTGIFTKFEIPQSVISELENPNLCEICFDSDISISQAVKLTCNHIFCLKCMKTYLEKNIENGKVKYYLN